MVDNFRVIFTGLADNVDAKTACKALAAKLKISEEKVSSFLKGNPLFAPSDKNKALKQAKVLASLGIKCKLQAISNNDNANTASLSSNSQRDKRIFDALDYITSSLIRLEEKLEDIEQRLPEVQVKDALDTKEDWQDNDLMLGEELTRSPKKRSNTLLYSLIATVVTLLIIRYSLKFTFDPKAC